MAKERIDSALDRVLTYYAKEVTKEIKIAAKEVAEEVRQRVRNTAPVNTGRYRKGWTVKKVYESANEIRYKLYNGPHYRLTHLLEKGTTKMRAQPHIKPAEEWGVQEFERRIKEAVKK